MKRKPWRMLQNKSLAVFAASHQSGNIAAIVRNQVAQDELEYSARQVTEPNECIRIAHDGAFSIAGAMHGDKHARV